ncbi:hypothetical protein GCM10028773_09670 [Spirosoma koreense]
MDRLFEHAYLSSCLTIYTDSTNALSIHQLDLNRFHPAHTSYPNFGTDGLSHWLTFTCQNNSAGARQFVVDIDIVYADEMSFYVQRGQKIVRAIEHDSWRVPIWQRALPSRYFAFPLDLGPYESVRIYIRAQEHSGTLITPVRISEKAAYEIRTSTDTLLFLIPAAALLVLALASFVLFLFSSRLLWLFYAGHALGTVIYNLNIEGFLAHYAVAPFNQIKGYAVGVAFGWVANLLFTRQYVYKRLPKPTPWLIQANYVVIAIQSAWFGYLLITPFQDHSADIALLLTGLTASFIFFSLLVSLARGSQEARFYLIAITPLLIIILLRVLDSADLIETQDWHYYARYYAPLFEIIVLGVGAVRQLIDERAETLTQLDKAQKEVIAAQETERRRLAADLHDDIGTSLVALRGKLGQNSDAEHLLDKIITDVRMVSHNLLPLDLHDLGLPDALAEVARRLETASGIRFLFLCSDGVVPLSSSADLIVYRTVQSLMQNIVRHSRASEAVIQLVYYEQHLNITVEDNGRGMDTQPVKNSRGIGLKNVHSRIRSLNGSVAIDSGPAGTTIRLDIPYPPKSNEESTGNSPAAG